MPRKKRERSQSGVHHVIVRGVNKCRIFEDTQDYNIFLKRLMYYLTLENVELYAYCLMNNHAHFLLKEDIEKMNLSNFSTKLLSSYAYYFNKKHGRVGHLFQGRFKSIPVEDNEYFMEVMVYIHNNPVKAGLVNYNYEYIWSSFIEHMLYHKHHMPPKISAPHTIAALLGLAPENYETVFHFRHINEIVEANIQMQTQSKLNDDQAFWHIIDHANIKRPEEIHQYPNAVRDGYILHFLKKGITCKQLARLTCIGEKYIYKLNKKK